MSRWCARPHRACTDVHATATRKTQMGRDHSAALVTTGAAQCNTFARGSAWTGFFSDVRILILDQTWRRPES
jgi:hypothetical protein